MTVLATEEKRRVFTLRKHVAHKRLHEKPARRVGFPKFIDDIVGDGFRNDGDMIGVGADERLYHDRVVLMRIEPGRHLRRIERIAKQAGNDFGTALREVPQVVLLKVPMYELKAVELFYVACDFLGPIPLC